MEKSMSRSELRQRQLTIRFQIGLVCVLLLLIGVFKLNLYYEPDLNVEPPDTRPYDVPVVIATLQEKRQPAPPRPAPPVAVPDETIIETPAINFDLEQIGIDYEPVSVPDALPEEPREEPPLLLPEKMPEMIGGLASLMESIKYPEIAKKAGVEGTVFIQFVVDTKGRVRDAMVVRGIGAGCDEEALKALQQITFTPGKQHGRAVAVRMSIPVRFKLK